MKFSSKLAILGIVAGLNAASVVIAEEAAPEVVTTPEETVVDEPTDKDTEEPTVDEEPTTDVETPSDEDTTLEDGGDIPLDWVKRGEDGEPDVTIYNMSGGGEANSGPASNAATNDAGKDEAATKVEAKTVSPAAAVVRVKKGPVALVKGARVFLRH